MDEKYYLDTICAALRYRIQYHHRILNKFKSKRIKSIDVDDITSHQKGLEACKAALTKTIDRLTELR